MQKYSKAVGLRMIPKAATPAYSWHRHQELGVKVRSQVLVCQSLPPDLGDFLISSRVMYTVAPKPVVLAPAGTSPINIFQDTQSVPRTEFSPTMSWIKEDFDSAGVDDAKTAPSL